MKHRKRITQVLVAITIFECIEYLFKQVDPRTDAGVLFGLNIHRTVGVFGIERSKNTFEVNPVNSPWCRFVGSVRMRDSCRKNKILIGGDGIFLVSDPVRSGAINTIDKDILIDGLFPFPKMMLGFGIISDVSDMQHGGQRVLFQFINDDAGQY